MSVMYILIAVAIILPVGLILWLKNSLKDNGQNSQFLILQQQMQAQMQAELKAVREDTINALSRSSQESREQVQMLSQQLNDRMKETSTTLQSTQTSVGERLDNAARVVGLLQNKLGNLEESSKKIFELGQGLQELRDIMKSPKLRGNMGEFFLEDLLRQLLPPDHFYIQHAFKSGETVDAVIKLGSNLVSVDSKFPLESFVRLIQIPEDQGELRKKEKRAFVTALKKHADAIAKKYILPDEGTLDFALMYIPAENVYYETIIRDDLIDDDGSLYAYLLSRRVVPVSPNSLYAYLQVIVQGLKGMRIQEHAQQIQKELARLAGDLGKFRDDHNVLGKHLKNASNSYDEGVKRLDKFEQRYSMVTHIDGDKPQIES